MRGMTREEYFNSLRTPEYVVLASAHKRALERQKAVQQAGEFANLIVNKIVLDTISNFGGDIKISIK